MKILFVYIGYEQGSWGNIAFSRPWHYYIMPGILCCADALRQDPFFKNNSDIKCIYFNRTVQTREEITDLIFAENPSCIGFSSFSWNIADSQKIANELKIKDPSIRVVMGGPEVSMKNAAAAQAFLDVNLSVDMLVFSEAEDKIAALLKSLLYEEHFPPGTLQGFARREPFAVDLELETPAIENSTQPIIPDNFACDVPRTPQCGLAFVYETSRGCPYRCIYCQFGHSSSRVRRFPMTKIEHELKALLAQRIDCIHVADAVFDLQPETAKEILRIIDACNISTSLFFYCSLRGLDEELVRLFARVQCQICVGIQSTNKEVLTAIRRTLSPGIFGDAGRLLTKYNINFYTDLIFGLPRDNIGSYAESFNQTLRLKPSFMMPFPLALITGTPLADGAHEYGMVSCNEKSIKNANLQCDIRYDNIALYRDFSMADLESFDDCTLAVFYFYNRFRLCLDYLENRTGIPGFTLYKNIGKSVKEYLARKGTTASNTNFIDGFQEEIFGIFVKQLAQLDCTEQELKAFKEIFKLDIFRILVLSSDQRRHVFEECQKLKAMQADTSEVGHNSSFMNLRLSTYGKTIHCAYSLNDLWQLATLKDEIVPAKEPVFIHAPFERWNAQLTPLSEIDRLVIELLPKDRPVKYVSLVASAQRQQRSREPLSTETLNRSIDFLMNVGILAGFRGKA